MSNVYSLVDNVAVLLGSPVARVLRLQWFEHRSVAERVTLAARLVAIVSDIAATV